MSLFRPSRHQLGLVGVALLATVVLWLAFPFVLASPDEYFMQPGGDGIQAYFATAYYTLYDAGSHFSGMNYPYGENFTYPNLQPAVAWTMGLLQRAGLPVAVHTVGITNLLALLGLWLTPLVMYSILRRFRVPVVYAGLLALLIAFLAPQVQRLGDHMSLSYACFVPWLWYCILRILDEPRRWQWYVVFGVSSLLMGFVMAYFLACGSFFLLAHVALLAIRRRGYSWGQLAAMTAAAIVPLLLFRGWVWFTDPTTDRPTNPYGFLVYVTSWWGLFTPALPPLRPLWAAVFKTPQPEYEGMAYVGLVGLGVLLASLARIGLNLLRGRGGVLTLRRLAPASLGLSLGAATLLAILASGLPFILPVFSKWVPYLGPLRQFRALGRFAWPFYYVLTTYAAYYLYGLWRLQRQRRLAAGALPWVPLLLLLWAGEAWANLAARVEVAKGGAGARAYMRPPHPWLGPLSWKNRYPNDFQAILPLPYFNIGSDKIVLEGSYQSIREAHRLALATGLPELSSYVSRPSVGQVLRHTQLLSGPLLEKELLRDFPNQKPLLLLVTPQPLTPAEQRLVSLATPLLATPEVQLYELPLAALAATTRAQELARATALFPTLPLRPDGLRTSTPHGIFRADFATSPDRRGRLAPGALADPGQARRVMYNGPLPAPADTGRYEISVWVSGRTAFGYGSLQVRQYAASGQELDYQYQDCRSCTEVDGDWMRAAVTIQLRPETRRLEVLYDNQDLLVDDLLIRPLRTDVYWKSADQQLILNGYRLGPAGPLAW